MKDRFQTCVNTTLALVKERERDEVGIRNMYMTMSMVFTNHDFSDRAASEDDDGGGGIHTFVALSGFNAICVTFAEDMDMCWC